jgi:Stigma-specific protein, Stig1
VNSTRFDGITRALALSGTRRTALRLLAGGLTAGLLAPRAATPVRAQSFDPCANPSIHSAVCDGHCVILSVDPFHCGACGVVCLEGEHCERGVCESRPVFFPQPPPPPTLGEEPQPGFPPTLDQEPEGGG